MKIKTKLALGLIGVGAMIGTVVGEGVSYAEGSLLNQPITLRFVIRSATSEVVIRTEGTQQTTVGEASAQTEQAISTFVGINDLSEQTISDIDRAARDVFDTANEGFKDITIEIFQKENGDIVVNFLQANDPAPAQSSAVTSQNTNTDTTSSSSTTATATASTSTTDTSSETDPSPDTCFSCASDPGAAPATPNPEGETPITGTIKTTPFDQKPTINDRILTVIQPNPESTGTGSAPSPFVAALPTFAPNAPLIIPTDDGGVRLSRVNGLVAPAINFRTPYINPDPEGTGSGQSSGTVIGSAKPTINPIGPVASTSVKIGTNKLQSNLRSVGTVSR